jgi:hypothetical protein
MDPAAAALLVLHARHDIDESSDRERELLLSTLMEAAWPTCWAQNQ